MRLTASVAALMTLIVALRLLATQTEPSGAMASVRGAVPTVTSASLARVSASNTLTESLSGFTTHRRGLAPLRGSRASAFDISGP